MWSLNSCVSSAIPRQKDSAPREFEGTPSDGRHRLPKRYRLPTAIFVPAACPHVYDKFCGLTNMAAVGGSASAADVGRRSTFPKIHGARSLSDA